MFRKLYSNSALIVLIVLAAGIWLHNISSWYSWTDPPTSVNATISATPTPAPSPGFDAWVQKQAQATPSPTFNVDTFMANRPKPTARCRDGTYSYSASRRGTCSWHGGVAQWLR